MINYMEEIRDKKVAHTLYFDKQRFFSMFFVWLLCSVFAYFPLFLRPLFVKDEGSMTLGYFMRVFSSSDILYLVIVMTLMSLGIAVLCGRRTSRFVYFIAIIEVIGVFLGLMGYLMLEGNAYIFGENVLRINILGICGAFVLATALFCAVSFRVKEGTVRI